MERERRLAREEYVQGKLTAEEFLRKIDTTHELTSYEVDKIDLPDEVETDADGMVTAYWICNRHPLGSNSAVDAAGLTWQKWKPTAIQPGGGTCCTS